MYTAYVLDGASRTALALRFPPKYSKFVGHHVTHEFGVPKDAEAPAPADVRIVGYVDSEDGLEALVCTVDGTSDRPDGSKFHITWSLDPDKYKPMHSNELVSKKRSTLMLPIRIRTTPEVLK